MSDEATTRLIAERLEAPPDPAQPEVDTGTIRGTPNGLGRPVINHHVRRFKWRDRVYNIEAAPDSLKKFIRRSKWLGPIDLWVDQLKLCRSRIDQIRGYDLPTLEEARKMGEFFGMSPGDLQAFIFKEHRRKLKSYMKRALFDWKHANSDEKRFPTDYQPDRLVLALVPADEVRAKGYSTFKLVLGKQVPAEIGDDHELKH